jgi:hypothetical protein
MNSSKHLTGKRKGRSDKKEEPYICKICNYKSENEYNYKSHCLNNHLSKEEREKEFKYYCKINNHRI